MVPLTLSNFIGFGISALVTFFISFHLVKSYLKNKEKTVGCFASFIAFRFGLFFFFALSSLIYLISGSLLIPAFTFTIAWVMVFISLAFPSLLFVSLKWQALRTIYPGAIIGAGLLGVVFLVKEFSPAMINLETGLAFTSIPQISMMFYVFCKFFGVVPLAILFLSHVVNKEKWIKVRSVLIGLGLFWVVSTVIVPSYLLGVLAGIYCCIGDILMFVGIKHKKQEK